MDTTARLRYLKWDDKFHTEKPYYLYIDPPEGLPVSNFTTSLGRVETVRDLRGREHEFNLDDHGFTVRRQQLTTGILNAESIQNEYLPSLELLLRETLGQECEIIWFDWRTRSSDKSKTSPPAGTRVYLDDRTRDLAPVVSVHVDQSSNSAVGRVYKHAGDRAKQLLEGRVRILNIWRPYNEPVECYPIAICDGSTVPADTLVTVDVVRHSYVGEAYYPTEHNDYKWYFIDRQTKEEVLIFKMYDSDENVKAKCCPHVSFAQETMTKNPRPRESVEARALVFTPA